MISGTKSNQAGWHGISTAVLLLVLVAAPTGQTQAANGDLEALMARIAAAAETSVRYREEKTLAFLDRPLLSQGILRFAGPDQLVREVDGTSRTRYLLSASGLVIEEAGKAPKHISLGDYPALGMLMDTMHAILTGDLVVLRRLYSVGLQSMGDGWLLDLDPRPEGVSRFLSKIKVEGRGARIHRIETLERGGDRTLMTILRDG